METHQGENRVLHELAYIYIALAHGTDEHLSDEELDQIAERLKGWEIDTAQTVTSALKEAMDDYVSDGAPSRLERAVRVVREAFPKERRETLLNDLTEIALADGAFLYRESAFIDRIRTMLDAHLESRDGYIGRSWSILGTSSDDASTWTPVHDLALIYVTLAHRTDDDLSTEEITAIAAKLNEWVPEAHEDEILQIVQDALSVYVQGPNKQMFNEAVASIRERVPTHQLTALLSDLKFVADADGHVLDEEKRIIAQLTRAWTMSDPSAGAQGSATRP